MNRLAESSDVSRKPSKVTTTIKTQLSIIRHIFTGLQPNRNRKMNPRRKSNVSQVKALKVIHNLHNNPLGTNPIKTVKNQGLISSYFNHRKIKIKKLMTSSE